MRPTQSLGLERDHPSGLRSVARGRRRSANWSEEVVLVRTAVEPRTTEGFDGV